MGPVLGGVGLGLVWGWWLVIVAAPTPARSITGILILGIASVLLVAGVVGIGGSAAAVGFLAASGAAVFVAVAIREELVRLSATRR